MRLSGSTGTSRRIKTRSQRACRHPAPRRLPNKDCTIHTNAARTEAETLAARTCVKIVSESSKKFISYPFPLKFCEGLRDLFSKAFFSWQSGRATVAPLRQTDGPGSFHFPPGCI